MHQMFEVRKGMSQQCLKREEEITAKIVFMQEKSQ